MGRQFRESQVHPESIMVHVQLSVRLGVLLLLIAYGSGNCFADYSFREVKAFPAAEAHQGVAVDASHFYAITNKAVAKYDRKTGKLVTRWDSSDEVVLKHLNSGVVIGSKLYVAHSTWPTKPPENSIEVWDTRTMRHVGRKTLDEDQLALTWADRYQDAWWVGFASYGTAESVAKTKLVKYDRDWKPLSTWHFPAEVIDRFVPYSNSGGSFGPDGFIYATGHDRKEVYVLQLPKEGTTLKLIRTIPISIEGQAIAWDRANPGLLYGIRRKSKEVVSSRLVGDGAALRKAGFAGFDQVANVEARIILSGIDELAIRDADFLFDGGSLTFDFEDSVGKKLSIFVPHDRALTKEARSRAFQPVLISNSGHLEVAAILIPKSADERRLLKMLREAKVEPDDRGLEPQLLSRNLKLVITIIERRQTLKKYGPDALGWPD